MLYSEVSAAAQAAYAGLDVAAQDAEMRRNIANLPGGFVAKRVKERDYWYYQRKSPDGSPQQFFVGPDDDTTRALMARHAAAGPQDSHLALQKLARSAVELGCPDITIKHGRVIGRLLEHGFFKAGGLLVGTHAFLAYQNLFGVRWGAGAFTLDLDFAHAGRRLTLAIASNVQMDVTSAIESLEMGFIPVASKTTFKKTDEPDFDLDFLTTMGRNGDVPVFLPALNLTLQPLKFMELSLEDPMKCTLLVRNGPLVVNIPRPQRFALHKLIVHGERAVGQRTKANKDLMQAACLLDYLLEHDADLVHEAWRDVFSRGPGWRQRLLKGWTALLKAFPTEEFEARLTAAFDPIAP
jgi:hypothetical protein